MALVAFNSTWEHILLYVATGLAVLFAYYKWSFQYWKKKDTPFVKPYIPFGTGMNPFKNVMYLGVHFKQLYDQLKTAGHKYGGVYFITMPVFVLVDPEIIQRLIQQDSHHFTERGFYYNEKHDPLSVNLFALGGQKWRRLRTKLSPAFTPGKIRMNFDNILKCSYQMKRAIDSFREKGEAVDAKEIMGCYTTDVIGSCAFGLECNSFTHPDAEFRRHGRKIFDFSSKSRVAKTVFAFLCPHLAGYLGVTLFDKPCSDFFINVVRNTVQFRKDYNVVRKDMFQQLMELDGDNFIQNEDTINELAAQVFVFFAAGFETSSTTLTFCLFELAVNPDIQEKLRNEVIQVSKKHNGEFTYEAIMEMKYMDQVVDETLRKYPPVAFITRICTKRYAIPDSKTVLENGMGVLISIFGLHRDPEHYPEPDIFDPERFSEENKKRRVPFTFIPFGEGPRICIGARFGLMQIKVGLAVLLRSFRFSLNQKTVLPLTFEKFSFTLVPSSDILLDVQALNN